jgi:hypothetical protein
MILPPFVGAIGSVTAGRSGAINALSSILAS